MPAQRQFHPASLLRACTPVPAAACTPTLPCPAPVHAQVTYVRNFTDVDDKIIARAAQSGEDPLALARRFITEFHADMVGPAWFVHNMA